MLLDHKADVEARNAAGMTALIQAGLQGHTECIRVLLDANANIDARDKTELGEGPKGPPRPIITQKSPNLAELAGVLYYPDS